MNISGITHTALSGMSKQTNRLSEIAGNIANGNASIVATASTDVDLGTQLTDLVEVAQIYKANATVFETGADLWEILGSIKRD
ncbi:flagellar basal body rod protein [Rhizobium cauense]|uniref:flagellar basal body rod protein n=1 Tax=Rhizobium cauense TaxID=1166683 RepID=UPI001C6EB7CA|nr:flagellar basal body rod protein [Rhizobium cauense]MBW9114991.1 flagellar basal body rod protein [Rhizobium cauense]